MLGIVLMGVLGTALLGSIAFDWFDDSDDDEQRSSDEETGSEDEVDALPEIIGTDGNDELIGSDADEAIYGLGGDDTLMGGGGDDLLDLGDGSESGTRSVAQGEEGDDTIIGGTGFHRLYGGAGDDELHLLGSFERPWDGDDEAVDGEPELASGGPGEDTIYVEESDLGEETPGVWVALNDGVSLSQSTSDDVAAQDTVIIRDGDADVLITRFELGGADSPTGDMLDLSELTNTDGDPITVDDVDLYFNQSSGQFYNAFISIPTGPDGETLRIRLNHINFGQDNGIGGPNLPHDEFLSLIGIPA
ncbi:hypothetical protein G5B38_05830 [Pseudohalocynthiibacter aestuariivivens]|nr:hypothetical protein [Pseudohalocynthiibacter aestuariivivens]QIE45089.1 hypothetical protein G5B38_05830 [Pseudohalocynthiibacter aestuariivivens]